MSDWEHHESQWRRNEEEWEHRQFQEWEDKEFNDKDVSNLREQFSSHSQEQIEFAVRDLSISLRNLIDVVDRNVDTYENMVPSTLHAALMALIDEITKWDWR